MWIIVLLLYLVTGTRQLSITKFSVPNVIEIGEDVRLQCRYQLDPQESDKALFVKWWFTPQNGTSDQRSQMYQRIAGHEAAAIHHDIKLDENDDILLLNVTPADSGVYECEVSNIDEVRRHSSLLVYTKGSGPSLNITLIEDGSDDDEEEDALITCSASDVSPSPYMYITVDGEYLDSEELLSGPEENLYDITSSANVSKSKIEGVEVACLMFYREMNSTEYPHYSYTITYHSDESALSTTELVEESTTETSDILKSTCDAGFGLASSALLVIATFFISLSLN
ncbi:hypothetical protein KGM_208484 [Danaus plexippus plexippus]|uniref:Uncharacterized protein n=1 Tax=Danaus plexippus plexippus TaxID=278856 RepID=A0A212F3M3_DANPL|nr:hypothetical protein KGM_208484 [Danaus plexippus plexippus]